jgi:hypothetical protein
MQFLSRLPIFGTQQVTVHDLGQCEISGTTTPYSNRDSVAKKKKRNSRDLDRVGIGETIKSISSFVRS